MQRRMPQKQEELGLKNRVEGLKCTYESKDEILSGREDNQKLKKATRTV